MPVSSSIAKFVDLPISLHQATAKEVQSFLKEEMTHIGVSSGTSSNVGLARELHDAAHAYHKNYKADFIVSVDPGLSRLNIAILVRWKRANGAHKVFWTGVLVFEFADLPATYNELEYAKAIDGGLTSLLEELDRNFGVQLSNSVFVFEKQAASYGATKIHRKDGHKYVAFNAGLMCSLITRGAVVDCVRPQAVASYHELQVIVGQDLNSLSNADLYVT
ncbi:hypothetical protein HDU93_005609 [Gonapodya sp. JEL0774]|nr:hypothetical protein HDU93_005609 [Gonapodya sp. JEL0774]